MSGRQSFPEELPQLLGQELTTEWENDFLGSKVSITILQPIQLILISLVNIISGSALSQ